MLMFVCFYLFDFVIPVQLTIMIIIPLSVCLSEKMDMDCRTFLKDVLTIEIYIL